MCRDINHTPSHWSACSYWLQCHLSDDFLSQALRYSNEERLKENIHTNMCDGWICFPVVNQYPQVFSKESLIHREHGVIKGHLNTEVQSLRLKGQRFWPSTFDPGPVVKQQQRCKHRHLCWVFILSSNVMPFARGSKRAFQVSSYICRFNPMMDEHWYWHWLGYCIVPNFQGA